MAMTAKPCGSASGTRSTIAAWIAWSMELSAKSERSLVTCSSESSPERSPSATASARPCRRRRSDAARSSPEACRARLAAPVAPRPRRRRRSLGAPSGSRRNGLGLERGASLPPEKSSENCGTYRALFTVSRTIPTKLTSAVGRSLDNEGGTRILIPRRISTSSIAKSFGERQSDAGRHHRRAAPRLPGCGARTVQPRFR